MTISTLAQLSQAVVPPMVRTIGAGMHTATAPAWVSGYTTAGGASPGNTTSGILPTAGTSIFPSLGVDTAFTPYISEIHSRATIGGGGAIDAFRFWLCDCLWHAGAFALNTATTFTFTSQPSYAGRLPGGNYNGTFAVVEIAGATGGSSSGTWGYTNQAGTPGMSAAWSSAIAGNWLFKLPFASGDSGIQSFDSFTISATTNANVYLAVVRPLALVRCDLQGLQLHLVGIDGMGMPMIYPTSAIWPMVIHCDSNGVGWNPTVFVDLTLVQG